jgi:hypothetical protein
MAIYEKLGKMNSIVANILVIGIFIITIPIYILRFISGNISYICYIILKKVGTL